LIKTEVFRQEKQSIEIPNQLIEIFPVAVLQNSNSDIS